MFLFFWLVLCPWTQIPTPAASPPLPQKAAPSATSPAPASAASLDRPTSPHLDPLADWPWEKQKSLEKAIERLSQPPPPAPKDCEGREPGRTPIQKGSWKALVFHGDHWRCTGNGTRWLSFQHYLRGELHGVSISWPAGGYQLQWITYHRGRKQGLAYIWESLKKRLCRMSYQEDQRHGEYRCWHENGQPAEVATYGLGKLQGTVMRWHKDGRLEAKLLYRDGLPQGTHLFFHPNGEKHARQTFNAQGQRHGRWGSWFDDGKRQTLLTFRGGYSEGLATAWHPNGRLAYKTWYRRSLAEGLSSTYHPNGEIHHQGHFQQSQPCGPWRCFDPSGKRLSCHTILLAHKPLSETAQGAFYPPCQTQAAKPPKRRRRCVDCAEKRLRYLRLLRGKERPLPQTP